MRPALVLVPPDLDPLEGLFVRDPATARLRLRVAAAVGGARDRGAALLTDLGTAGLDAAETAGRAARRGVSAALVVGGPFDRASGRALAAALRACGVPTTEAYDAPPGEAGRALERFVRERAEGADPRSPAPLPFSDPVPPPLVRRGDEDAVFAMLVDEPPGDEAARAARRAARAGSLRLRLALEPSPADDAGGAPAFAAARLLLRTDVRARTEAVVRTAAPHARYVLARAVAWAEAGLDPFLAAYAGDTAACRAAASVFPPDDVEEACAAFPELRPFASDLSGGAAEAALGASAAAPRGIVRVRRSPQAPLRFEPIDDDGEPPARPDEVRASVLPFLDGPGLASDCASHAVAVGRHAAEVAPLLLRRDAGGVPRLVAAPAHGAEAWAAFVARLRPDRAAAVRAAVATRGSAPL